MRRRPDLWERCFAKVVVMPSGCWEWKGTVAGKGYGTIKRMVDGHMRRLYVHRTVYALVYGPIPEGLFVLHHCDNPPCVNPKHLFVGTNADNMADAARKGRPDGARRLTPDQVRAMRRRYREGGVSTRTLAREFGVWPGHAHRIVAGKARQHVVDES